VTNLDEQGGPQEFTGRQLAEEGLLIVIRDQPGDALLSYRQKK
jgi:hypothetical protein